MKNKKQYFGLFLGFIFMVITSFSFANAKEHKGENHTKSHEEGPIDTPEKINAYIKHHLQDAHDFTFFINGSTGNHIGFSLPVILVDNGLHVFSAAKFHHGEAVAESKGSFYKLHHGKIYKTNKEGVLRMHGEHPLNFKPLDLSITKSVFGMLLTGVLMLIFFGALAKSYKKGPIPTGLGRALEPLVLYVRDEIARPNIGESKYKKFMPFLLTIFFFIFINTIYYFFTLSCFSLK